MKSISRALFMGITICGMATACTPEHVQPSQGRDQGSSPQLLTISPICSFEDTLRLQSTDGSFTVNNMTGTTAEWGSVAVYNTDEDLVVNIQLSNQQSIDVIRYRIDMGNNYTYDANGFPVITSDFVVDNPIPNPNSYQIVLSKDSIEMNAGDCFSIALNLTIGRTSFLGSIIPSSVRSVWGYNTGGSNVIGSQVPGSPYVLPFCWQECPPPPFLDSTEVCTPLLIGNSGLNPCVELAASFTGQLSSPSFVWSTGETTQTIFACPTTTSSYRVSVYESGQPVTITKFTVNAVDVSCEAGNSQQHKVIVCHRPPGNPGNTQEICIDFSGVPAHVAAYRGNSFNQNQGHDSGCEIGQCGYDPCN